MKLFQPMLFLGLGGTGCLIGAELERRLREELCGPDGSEFARRHPGGNLLPYQLPAALQFVYADVNRAELDRLPRRVVPGEQHIAAAQQTAHYVRDLVPAAYTYPEVARSLRLSADKVVAPWLPPGNGEPRVSPLDRGAGQFPTVGRAALFETFRHGVGPAIGPLHDAIGRLSTSGPDLQVLGGRPPVSCDVFVAFSVAGGTGAGIFYDYIHLVGRTFEQVGMRVKIYPLVLMPSAFDDGRGGGRFARLNAGRALLDIFRLVDSQNTGGASLDLLGATTEHHPDDVAVRYPREGRVELSPATMQTAFLFSRPPGAEREDLHRSVVSLILSLAGADLDSAAGDGERPADETHQSFADSFINSQAEREVPAESGIGNRGVSTALVASMTVPVDELSDIVGARLLRAAVEEMSQSPGAAESNRVLLEEFFTLANLNPLLARTGIDFAEPQPAHGARDITSALFDRGDAMRRSLQALRERLSREAPELAARFDHRVAVRTLMGKADPFRVRRTVLGNPAATDEVDRMGVVGMLNYRRTAPPPPQGLSQAPPGIPEVRDRMGGVVKARWGDPAVVQTRAAQDSWFLWQSHVAWGEAWSAAAARWNRAAAQLEAEVTGLTEALVEHARADHDRFEQKSRELYRPRTGISYLLPPTGDNLEPFYRRVRDRLIEARVAVSRLRPNSNEADLVGDILGDEGWRRLYERAVDSSPAAAVAALRERLKTEIKQFLRNPGPARTPLLPQLSHLLAQAAGQGDHSVDDADVNRFEAQLAGLLPAGYSPQGAGPLKILVTYHAPEVSPRVEQYLSQAVNLPRDARMTYEYRPTAAESISVVLFRSSMSVTEVREVREVMRLWSDALARQQPQDYLRWRQRLGYDFGYLATTEEHRQRILHRMLNALWNGRAKIEGDPRSPSEVRFVLGGGVAMPLRLSPLDRASSWGSLLRAYETWVFNGEDGITRQFCEQLMMELPEGVETRPVPPAEPYRVLRMIADEEARQVERLVDELPPGQAHRAHQLREFWSTTLPAALRREFEGATMPIRSNLLALEQSAFPPERERGTEPGW
ncbi:tubulin-like doman-containing protein [Allonocardiopsis opalescens]|nr:tubulin-like doman-containing protein [Allonocardiopsis opalescens]